MKLRSKCTQEYTIQSMMIQQVYLPRDEKVTKLLHMHCCCFSL